MMSGQDRALYLAMAAAWVLLGFASLTGTVPGADTGVWTFACTVPAGALIAVVRYQTEYAFNLYLGAVTVMAVARSVAYLTIDAWSPMMVWLIVAFTTVLALPSRCRRCRIGGA